MSLDKWLPPVGSGVGVAAAGVLGGMVKRWRHRARFGQIEDEALVTKLVNRAVETQGAVLEDLRTERLDDRKQIERLTGALAGARSRIDKLERQVGGLSRENGRLTSELGQVKRELEERQ